MRTSLHFLCIPLVIFLLTQNQIKAASGDSTEVRVHTATDLTWFGAYTEWGVFP